MACLIMSFIATCGTAAALGAIGTEEWERMMVV